jgi:hypothetical protein
MLELTNSSTIALGGVSGVATIDLSSLGANVVTLLNSNFKGVAGDKITVVGGDSGNTITADLKAGHCVVLEGGTGNDVFDLSAATIAISTIAGGGGDNLITDFAPARDRIAFSDAGFQLGLAGA